MADIDIETGKQKAGFRQLRAFLHDYPDSGLASGALRRVLIDVEDEGGDEAVLQYLDEQIPKLEKTELGEHLHYAYARRLETMGRKHKALQRYLFIADNYPYPQGALWDDALWNASLLEEELGRPRRAITHLERLLGEREPSAFMGSYERPRYSQSRFRIAELYRDKLRDQKRARTVFRNGVDKAPDQPAARRRGVGGSQARTRRRRQPGRLPCSSQPHLGDRGLALRSVRTFAVPERETAQGRGAGVSALHST